MAPAGIRTDEVSDHEKLMFNLCKLFFLKKEKSLHFHLVRKLSNDNAKSFFSPPFHLPFNLFRNLELILAASVAKQKKRGGGGGNTKI